MSFWQELRRRNVFKAGAAYLIVAWLLAQVAGVFAPALNLPEWVTSLVAFLLVLGFPLALVLAWAYEVTPQGIKRTKQIPLQESLRRVTGQRLNYLITALLVVAVGVMALDSYWLDRSGSASEPTADPGRDALPNSVAVLPCESFSTNPDNDFFAASLHDELLNQLQKLSSLSVFARTSVLRYSDGESSVPEIARELRAESVMECSVAYGEGRIVIRAQLIDGDTGLHLWSESYNRELADIFTVQADIARSVANALQAEFSSVEMEAIEAPPTDSLAAYRAYLRAREIRNTAGRIGLVLEYLDEAIRLDPEFALAHAWKARWYAGALISQFQADAAAPSEWAELERLVEQSARNALGIDESLWQAHQALALMHARFWRWTQAQQEFARAARTKPASAGISDFAIDLGNWADSIRLQREAVALNPNSPIDHWVLGLLYAYSGDAVAAADAIREAVALEPTNALYHLWLGHAEGMLGNSDAAITELELAEQLPGAYTSSVTITNLAYAYSRNDRVEDARRLFEILENRSLDPRFHAGTWALAYLAVGDHERARESLEIVADKIANHEPEPGLIGLRLIRWNPYADPVLDAPPFSALRAQLRGR